MRVHFLNLARFSMAALLLSGCIKRSEKDKEKPKQQQQKKAEKKPKADADPVAKDGTSDKEERKEKAREAVENLDALSYVDGTVDEDPRTGVGIKSDKAYQGFSVYSSRKDTGATLVDMEGRVMHRWETEEAGSWQHVTLLPNGDLLALVKDERVVRYNKDSVELWRHKARIHHDLWVHSNGDIYAAARTVRKQSRHPRWKELSDQVLILDRSGNVKGSIDLLGELEKSPYSFLIQSPEALAMKADKRAFDREKQREFDPLHLNHVEVLDGRAGGGSGIYAKGNVLVSYRNANSIAILHRTSHKILWLWGPNNLVYPHHPSVLENGNVLVFNNGHERLGSQLVEVDPRTDKITWEYQEKEFFSKARGSAQRLPNGNTLVTESDSGIVFELDPGKKKVWEFLNPARMGKKRMAIWRMTRFAPDELDFPFNRGIVPAVAGGAVAPGAAGQEEKPPAKSDDAGAGDPAKEEKPAQGAKPAKEEKPAQGAKPAKEEKPAAAEPATE